MTRMTCVLVLVTSTVACTKPNPAPDVSGTSGSESGSHEQEGDATDEATSGSAEEAEVGGSGGDGTIETGGADDSAADCPAGFVCFEQMAPGWVGPVVVRQGATDDGITCATPHESLSVLLKDELVAPAAECGCECGEPSSFDCEVVLRPTGWFRPDYLPHTCNNSALACALEGCSNLVNDDYHVALAAGCHRVPDLPDPEGHSAYIEGWNWLPVDDDWGGSCDAVPQVEMATARFEETIAACEVDRVEACDDQSCVQLPPTPFEETVCFWKEGDVACPEAGEFSQRRVLYTGIADPRGCSECTCAAPQGSCEVMNASTDCNVVEGVVDQLGCDAEVGSYIAVVPNAGCQPSEVHAVGEATPSGPVTLCCAG